MHKFFERIAKLITSMSTRRHNHASGDDSRDTSRRSRDVPVTRPSRETMRSSAIPTPGYPTSYVRTEDSPTRTKSESKIPRNAQARVDAERDGAQHRRRSAVSTKDQGSMYSSDGERTKTRHKLRPRNEEDQHRYDGDRTDDRRDTPRGMHYPPPKGNFDMHRPPLAHAKDVEPIAPALTNFQHLYDPQLRELWATQHELRVALEGNKERADVNAALEQRYEERSKELSAVRRQCQTALEQRKETDAANAVLRQQYEEQTKELNAVHHECQAALEQKQKAEKDCASLRQKYEAQRNEYSALSNKYHSLKASLEQRTSELQGVQKFLTTADTFSGSEVVNTLRKLNEEVQQITTFMAEWMVESFMFQTPPTDQTTTQIIEQTRTSEILGMRFMQLLGTKKHRDNSILLDIAFRAYLIYELYCIASPWSVGQEEQSHNMYIDAIYQRIREAEGQAISGNWRALTRAYTMPACISNPEFAHTIDTTIISGFSDILLAAGCTASKSDITSALWSKFVEKIHRFVSLAGQVNKIIGVGVISEDFEVLAVWPDTDFDEKEMEDSYDNGDRAQGTGEHQGTVLCGTELGLTQRMRVGVGAGQKGQPSELIVIKPKVALMSVIDMIDE